MAGGACLAHMPPQQIVRDMVNEQAVCILLECILVLYCFQINVWILIDLYPSKYNFPQTVIVKCTSEHSYLPKKTKLPEL